MTDSKALIERLRSGRWLGETTGAKAADHIEKLEADNARLNDALRQAVLDAAEWARKAGEAQGKLEISEAAGSLMDGYGIVSGWKPTRRGCVRLIRPLRSVSQQ